VPPAFAGGYMTNSAGQKEIRMRISTLLTLGILTAAGSGCMSDVKPSNGGKTFSYDCSGLAKGWGDCSEKANAQCGVRNYTVVSQDGDAEAKGASGNTEMKRTMVVSCR
jgi:hypothetical protein